MSIFSGLAATLQVFHKYCERGSGLTNEEMKQDYELGKDKMSEFRIFPIYEGGFDVKQYDGSYRSYSHLVYYRKTSGDVGYMQYRFQTFNRHADWKPANFNTKHEAKIFIDQILSQRAETRRQEEIKEEWYRRNPPEDYP